MWRASWADVAVDCEEGSRLDLVSAEMEASEAAVEARCRIWSARFEALKDGLWKRVMGSRVLGWVVSSWFGDGRGMEGRRTKRNILLVIDWSGRWRRKREYTG